MVNTIFKNEKFEISYQDKVNNKILRENFDYVVVSTGHFSVPFIPEYKGMKSFPKAKYGVIIAIIIIVVVNLIYYKDFLISLIK